MYQGKALWLISCRVFGVDNYISFTYKSLGGGVNILGPVVSTAIVSTN